ncbi:LytR/AlgR family response regulator transcription factor [Niabella ginsengisoli]|uniref:LytTR family transcriptional regulator DNA-binding domain-containing protein n=1 Tax=Niabella ginsengisoli TaxID=522298 RepID=A0ABS9SQ98_9BACT|nr:LytTR family DNA-binding domain-containing protein [Niabella ginsengisoli]MCH5600550.1 LytTR family transcriptional regulator DNA-binding domain-containing protein [Niabella ginsengisoli]
MQEGLEFVAINTIVRCEGVNGYTKIYLTEGNTILSSNSIGYFNKLLDIDGFYLVHKSHLINLDYVLKYLNEGSLIMEDQEHVPVARNKRSEFLEFINNRGNKV